MEDRGAERAANACALGYRGYLPRALDRIHPYASPLQSSRLKGLPPALILSTEDDPLRDEAQQYAAKLEAAGVPVTARRLPAAGMDNPQARCECAHKESVLQEMAAFVAGLDEKPKTKA